MNGECRTRMTTGPADLLRLGIEIQCLHRDVQNRKKKISYRTVPEKALVEM